MSVVVEVFQDILQSSVPLQIAAVLGAYALLLTFIIKSDMGRRLLKNFRFFSNRSLAPKRLRTRASD